MSLALMLVLQAATSVQPVPGARDFDLKNLRPAEGFELKPASIPECGDDAADEIVVCGSRSQSDRYRLPPLPSPYQTKPVIAEIGVIGDVSARIRVESVEFPNGMISKRLMVTFTTPF
jgi:hypothetical protein